MRMAIRALQRAPSRMCLNPESTMAPACLHQALHVRPGLVEVARAAPGVRARPAEIARKPHGCAAVRGMFADRCRERGPGQDQYVRDTDARVCRTARRSPVVNDSAA